MQLYFIKYENRNNNNLINMVCVSLKIYCTVNAFLILNQSDDIVEVIFGPSEFLVAGEGWRI